MISAPSVPQLNPPSQHKRLPSPPNRKSHLSGQNTDSAQVRNPEPCSMRTPQLPFASSTVCATSPPFQDERAIDSDRRTDGCSSSCRDRSSCVPSLFQTPRRPREVVTARPCSVAPGRRGGFLRRQKTNEQNVCVLLRFVKSFNRFFYHRVWHFRPGSLFWGTIPLEREHAYYTINPFTPSPPSLPRTPARLPLSVLSFSFPFLLIDFGMV